MKKVKKTDTKVEWKAEMEKFEKEILALKAALAKTGTKSVFAGKKRKNPDAVEISTKGTIRGKPHGRIVHKQYGYGASGAICERYLVVTPDLWYEIDDDNHPITNAERPDPFGQVHWENNCPNRKQYP